MRMLETYQFELLEPRVVPCAPCDVNGDGAATPQDVLVLVNAINEHAEFDPALDVNGDQHVTPMDVLFVVNWLNDQIPPVPTHKIRFAIRDTDIYSFTDQQVRDTVFATLDEFESRWNLEFVEVSQPPYQFVVTTAELYSGYSNVHYGGLFNYDTNELFLNSGYAGPYRHSGRLGPINQGVYWVGWQLPAIQQIAGHEILHSFGFDHSNDPTCRSHSNAPPGFCQAEIVWFESRFGISQRVT